MSTTPSPPHWFSYSDQYQPSLPDASTIPCINVFALCFLLPDGPNDNAKQWTTLSNNQRQQMKTAYNNAGIKLIVGALTSSDADAKQTAQTLANWVKQYDLDGIDVGFLDPHAFENGSAEDDISSLIAVAPWFCPNKWPGGGYLYINKEVGSMIDWYNIQFYNWGESEYTDCNSLLFDSSSAWPQSSIFQINANGVDLSKLVTGEPATTQDAVNGYIDPSTFAGYLSQAKAKGWDAGVAGWQWPRANNDWFRAIRAQSWLCGPFGGE